MSENNSSPILKDKYFRLAWLLLIFPIYKLIEGIIVHNTTNVIIYAGSAAGLLIILIVTSIIYTKAIKKRAQF
ncbi:MAG: hypothetical protein EU530_07090 [Promethearchaeota archaeon]|nr:MAG: hypothetical protein EU530_07090 [Candidatus Lokiarchaeota archaeon]